VIHTDRQNFSPALSSTGARPSFRSARWIAVARPRAGDLFQASRGGKDVFRTVIILNMAAAAGFDFLGIMAFKTTGTWFGSGIFSEILAPRTVYD